MKVVVFGATGFVGGYIAAELRSRGHDVVAVARSGEGVRAGSVFDRTFVSEITTGADVVVSALPALLDDDHGVGDAITVLLEAARSHDARLAGVGGAGSLPLERGGQPVANLPGVPDIVKVLTAAHEKALAELTASAADVDWFYLIPAMDFGPQMPGERTGEYRVEQDVLVTDSAGKSTISAADYAIAFADELERPQHHRQVFTVGY